MDRRQSSPHSQQWQRQQHFRLVSEWRDQPEWRGSEHRRPYRVYPARVVRRAYRRLRFYNIAPTMLYTIIAHRNTVTPGKDTTAIGRICYVLALVSLFSADSPPVLSHAAHDPCDKSWFCRPFQPRLYL